MYKTYMSVVASLLMVVSVTANAGPGKRPGDTSIYEIAKSTTIHTTLVALLDRVGLGEGGATDVAGQFTVFAPTDEAFDKLFTNLYANLPAEAVDALLEDDDFITGVLLYHVVDGRRQFRELLLFGLGLFIIHLQALGLVKEVNPRTIMSVVLTKLKFNVPHSLLVLIRTEEFYHIV